MTPDKLKALIVDAWADAQYPGDDAITYDKIWYHLECKEVAGFFRRKHWKDITLPVLRKYRGDASACLNFMSPEACQFYLPAYMLIAIDNHDEADVVADSALNMLLPSDDPSLANYWRERAAGFSPKQRKAIVSFLRFLQQHYSSEYPVLWPQNALPYWEAAV
jgi:hypothetical protein